MLAMLILSFSATVKLYLRPPRLLPHPTPLARGIKRGNALYWIIGSIPVSNSYVIPGLSMLNSGYVNHYNFLSFPILQ
jgi:hypothetical protein